MKTEFNTKFENIVFSFSINAHGYKTLNMEGKSYKSKDDCEKIFVVHIKVKDTKSNWRNKSTFFFTYEDYCHRCDRRGYALDLINDNLIFPEIIDGDPSNTEEYRHSLMMLRRLMKKDLIEI